MTPMAKDRNEVLQKMTWAFGTLKSAVSNISIGEDIDDCQDVVANAREVAKQQIKRIRLYLVELEKIKGTIHE